MNWPLVISIAQLIAYAFTYLHQRGRIQVLEKNLGTQKETMDDILKNVNSMKAVTDTMKGFNDTILNGRMEDYNVSRERIKLAEEDLEKAKEKAKEKAQSEIEEIRREYEGKQASVDNGVATVDILKDIYTQLQTIKEDRITQAVDYQFKDDGSAASQLVVEEIRKSVQNTISTTLHMSGFGRSPEALDNPTTLMLDSNTAINMAVSTGLNILRSPESMQLMVKYGPEAFNRGVRAAGAYHVTNFDKYVPYQGFKDV